VVRFHRGLVTLLCVQVFLVLLLGGYRHEVLGVTIRATHVAPPVMALLFLTLAAYLLRYKRIEFGAFAGHEGVALFALTLLVYLANETVLGSGDTIPARYLPLSILREGNFDLDEFDFIHADGEGYYLTRREGHYVSTYPVAASLLAVPIYALSAAGPMHGSSNFVLELDKLSAAVIVALSVVLTYFTARRMCSNAWALFVAVAYAFGSSSLSTSSQALWQHGPSQLALSAALYCLVRGREEPQWVARAGFPLAFAIVSRPTDLVLVLPIGVYLLLRHWRSLPGVAATAVPPLAFHFWYAWTYFGDPFRLQLSPTDANLWSTPFLVGLSGILLSPARGLFVYSPVFAAAILGGVRSWVRGGDPLLRAVSVGVILNIVLYSHWIMWWGGHSYGPRLLADLLPYLALLLCPLEPWFVRPWARVALRALLAWSIAAHAAGAFWQDGRWNAYPNVDRAQARLWSWTDNPLVYTVTDLAARAASILRVWPDSATGSALVVTSYVVARLPPAAATPGSEIELSIRATNEGKAIWISRARQGEIGLGWRWIRAGTGQAADVIPLHHDVFPGRTYEFRLELRAPTAPGEYVLDAGLVSKTGSEVTWVSQNLASRLQFPVAVNSR
jgi:hypothetical protein